MKLYIHEAKYDLDWKEIGTETLYIDNDKLRLPRYEKRINKVVIQVVPEDDNNELVWTVYYTPEIGMAGFKFVESGFFTSGEAMDYVDNEFISKLDIVESKKSLNIKEGYHENEEIANLLFDIETTGDSRIIDKAYSFIDKYCDNPDEVYNGDYYRFRNASWGISEDKIIEYLEDLLGYYNESLTEKNIR